MTLRFRKGPLWLLVVALVACVVLAGASALGPARPSAAGTMYADVSPVVFLGETPANGSLLGLMNPVTLIAVAYYDASPGATILGVSFYLDGMNLTSAGYFNDTAFTLPVGFALRDGPHFANFLLIDSYGTVAYHNWTFTVDTIPPILIVTSPAYPMVPYPAIPVNGTAFPALAAAAPVNVTVTALPSHVSLWTLANVSTGAFSILMPLSPGTNILFVNATDAAGNLASEIKSLISDTTKPVLQVLTPTNLSISPTNIVRVAGISEFGAYLTVNGFSVLVTPNGTWSVYVALPEGVNVIQVVAADQVGNLNYAIVVVIVDSTTPQVTLTTPLPALTNRSSFQVAGYANDSMMYSVIVRANQLLPAVTYNAATGAFKASLTNLPDGTYTVQVIAVDVAGRSTVVTSRVVVDTTPPVVRVSLPPDGLETNQSTLRLTGTVDDAAATVLVNDQEIRPDATGHWTTTVALVQGSNVIRVSAVDAAGNQAAAVLLHVTYASPYPDLANRTTANEANLEALAGFARLSLVGVLIVALAVAFILYMRVDRRVRENRRLLTAIAQAMRKKPGPPKP